MSSWCDEHQYAIPHTEAKRVCPWCELESVQLERDKWKDAYDGEHMNAMDAISERDDLQHKLESLQRDKAALIEVLERIADVHLDRESDGEARTIIAKMKGETP